MSAGSKKVHLSGCSKILILVFANLLLFIILLYGFEFYLAQADPKLKLPPKPVEIRNKYGFRGPEFTADKPPHVCRIVALGDSFTWGKGVWEHERYSDVLETILNEAYPEKKFEVVNFGFPGAPTTRERSSLRDYRELVKPDLITVGFVLNDPQPKSQNYSVERQWFEHNFGDPIDQALEYAEDIRLERLADLTRKALDSFIVKVGLVPSWQVALQRVYEKDSIEWVEFEQALRDIKTMSDQMDLPQPIFVVLNQGSSTLVPTDYGNPDTELQLYLRWYHQAEETAALLGFNPINFEREFAEQLAGQILAANALDGHPSPRMHQIYAKKLFDEIKDYVDSGQLCSDDTG